MLAGKKTFISHIIHDEIVIDLSDDERDMIKDIKDSKRKCTFNIKTIPIISYYVSLC